MDPVVKAAMRKWPTVPHCYGWLALDARGDWYLRDEPTQAAGPFPRPKGSRIEHDGLREFIERNYESDARGCWYFQNGPQRVYVELEAAPRVYRLESGDAGAEGKWRISLALQRTAHLRSVWLDESGRLFLDCDLGFGLLHSLDMALAAQAIEAGDWQPQEMEFQLMPAHFGYALRPLAAGPGA